MKQHACPKDGCKRMVMTDWTTCKNHRDEGEATRKPCPHCARNTLTLRTDGNYRCTWRSCSYAERRALT